jgi:creatinine amidohydrolase/Fe(II)-dependent formamide hydrolase-like protein
MKTGSGIYYGVRSYKALTPYGSIGDPTLAKPETGEKGYAVIVEWLSMVIKRDFFDERGRSRSRSIVERGITE